MNLHSNHEHTKTNKVIRCMTRRQVSRETAEQNHCVRSNYYDHTLNEIIPNCTQILLSTYLYGLTRTSCTTNYVTINYGKLAT